MKLKNIYNQIIREGTSVDPRNKETIENGLRKQQERFQSLKPQDKGTFDREALVNPYADTRILNGDPETQVKTALVGIDIDGSELLFIDRFNKENKKQKIDLAISHHPQGLAYAHFYEVMDMQADIFHDLGIPINVTEHLVEERKREVGRKIHAANHHRTTDMAKILKIPFLCMHTPADNHAVRFLEQMISLKNPQTLQEIMNRLNSIEEYKISSKEGVAPCILFGKPENRCGKIFIDMTGGTEGPRDIIDNLLQVGIGTLIGMHLSEEHFKKLQGKNINVIVAGHIASDNLGMNLLLDKIEKTSKIDFLTCSGFRRIKR